jgi:peptidoglycan/xylan/chitin deacetylase (PgdA/CDA1 family)
MRIPGKKFVAQSLKRARRRFVPHGLILGYHRISNDANDPFGLNVSPRNFSEQLEVLKALAKPTSVASLIKGRGTPGAITSRIALTFDDGYRDYLVEALPCMERFDIPSTVFVTTGAIGGEFWWDRLARLSGSESGVQAILGALEPKGHRRSNGGRNRTSARSPVECAYAELLQLDQSGIEKWLLEVEENAPVEPNGQTENPVLSADEIADLAAHALVDVGCHTVTHPRLSLLDAKSQLAEMKDSKNFLEQVVHRNVEALSYPNGSRSPETVRIAERAGFRFACASHADVVWRGSKPYDLPRLWAPNCSGDAFGRWLRQWF